MSLNREIIEAYDLAYGGHAPHRCADGTELYYELRGEGPNLCIINNMYIVSPLWRNFTTSLVSQHQILSYDLRNQGASSRIKGDFEFSQHVEDLLSLLDRLEIERTYLLGTSISTLICRDFAAAHPERVKGLLLFGPVFNPVGSKRRKYLTRSWLKSLEAGGPAALFNHFYPLVFGDHTIENGGSAAYLALRERFLALNSQEQLRQNLSASLTTDDDAATLGRISCPTLLAAGDGDFLNSRSSLDATGRLFPDARVETVPFAGHVPYFEATDRFEALVGDFTDSCETDEPVLKAAAV
jgi:3-oxoadipate enol-lactonase